MDDVAFEAFWRTHHAGVARVATAITGDLQEGEDLAQEAFARTYQRWRRVGRMDRPDAWVYRVATNLALSHRRRRATAARVTLGSPHPSPGTVEPPDDELLDALRALPKAQRAAVVLRFYLDWSVDDVAEAMGNQPGTVRALTHQGMDRLREALTKELHDD